MAAHEPIPKDYEVQPIVPGGSKPWADGVTQCGHCGLYWDDSVLTGITPAPSARCPFEPFHVYEEDDEPGWSGDLLTFVLAFEQGNLTTDEQIAGFQHLVDTGIAWQLQGIYGRTAQALINAGLVEA